MNLRYNKRMDDEAGMSWLTYAEIAAALGLPNAKAAEARCRRAKWARTRGNDGLARVAVPHSVLASPMPLRRPHDPPTLTPDDGGSQPIQAFLAELRDMQVKAAALGERAAAAEGELRGLREVMARDVRQLEQAEAARLAAETQRDAAQAARDATQAELAALRSGGPLARAWRASLRR